MATSDEEALHELERIPAHVALQIERSWDDAQRLDRLGELQGGTVVARGVNFATAYETALKIRELSGLLFEAYSAADLMHGPIAAVGAGLARGRRSRRAGRRSTRWRPRSARSRNAAHG